MEKTKENFFKYRGKIQQFQEERLDRIEEKKQSKDIGQNFP